MSPARAAGTTARLHDRLSIGLVILGLLAMLVPFAATASASTVFFDSFESGLGAWKTTTAAGGVVTVQSSVVRTGSYAAALSETSTKGSTAYARHAVSSPLITATLSGDFDVRAEGPSGYNVPLIRAWASDGKLMYSLYRQNQDGNKVWLLYGAAYHATTGLLPLNTWAHVDVAVTVNGGSKSAIDVSLNGASIFHTTSANVGNNWFQTVQLGNEHAAEPFSLVADNITISNSSTAALPPTSTPKLTTSPAATATVTPAPTPSATAAPTATPTVAPTSTPAPTPTPAPTSTAAPVPTSTATAAPTVPASTAPTTTPTPTTNVDPSGEAMPVGDITVNGQAWHQVFTDDFPTNVPLGSFPSAVNTNWRAYPDGWPDTSHNGTYNCTKVCSVSGGLLNLYLHTEGSTHYVAAPVPIIPGSSSSTWGDNLYARYVIRFRADSLPGYKTAWLLWPQDGVWPQHGEIDFPEGDLDGHFCAFMHWMNATSGTQQDAYCPGATFGGWHTAVIDWLPNRVTFTLDGVVIGNSTANIPSTPMHWVIQTETSLDEPAPASSTAGNVQIDWVAVYRPA